MCTRHFLAAEWMWIPRQNRVQFRAGNYLGYVQFFVSGLYADSVLVSMWIWNYTWIPRIIRIQSRHNNLCVHIPLHSASIDWNGNSACLYWRHLFFRRGFQNVSNWANPCWKMWQKLRRFCSICAFCAQFFHVVSACNPFWNFPETAPDVWTYP